MSLSGKRRSFAVASVVFALAVIGCGGGTHGGSSVKGTSTGSTATSGTDGMATSGTTATNPDPNFSYDPNSVPDVWLVVFATGACQRPTASDEGNAAAVAASICDKHGAKIENVFGSTGIFFCGADEKTARAMSHDPRVKGVGSDIYTEPDPLISSTAARTAAPRV